jgi:hypothetical protein
MKRNIVLELVWVMAKGGGGQLWGSVEVVFMPPRQGFKLFRK